MLLRVGLFALEKVVEADPARSAIIDDSAAFLHLLVLRDADCGVAVVLIDFGIGYSPSVLKNQVSRVARNERNLRGLMALACSAFY